eukprot:Gb_09705 [translate_table: standard]
MNGALKQRMITALFARTNHSMRYQGTALDWESHNPILIYPSRTIQCYTVRSSRALLSYNVDFGPKTASGPFLLLPRVVIYDGVCHLCNAAALKVLSYLSLPYSALSVFLLIPAPIRNAIYDYVANRRYDWFGKSAECIIPDNEVLDRFIDREEMLERQKARF